MNESLEFRVRKTEDNIMEINGELKDIKNEMKLQEDRLENKIEEKFREFELKLDKNNDSQQQKSERILQTLETIKDSQHNQDIKNIETENKLTILLNDKEEQKEESKKTKWWLMTIAGGLIGSILLKLFPIAISHGLIIRSIFCI